MTGHTTDWQLPYPEPADFVSDSQATMQELAEKIDAALSQVTASDSYTVPGMMVQEFTASGTFTPPPGVTTVHVAVIGGGGSGAPWTNGGGGGGAGGAVRVYRDIPVSGPVAVTVGAANTASSFGAHTAPGGANGNFIAPGLSENTGASHGGAGGAQCGSDAIGGGTPGTDGVQINGTYYAGGGGGSAFKYGGAGGAGGGGKAQTGQGVNGSGGTNGLGGGGGGSRPGASGRVIVWTEQAYRRSKIAAPEVDPRIVAALDDTGTMLGAYAVDPYLDLDNQTDPRLVPFPADPQPTGDTYPDPDNPATVLPVLAWPVAGWIFDGTTWQPPTEEATP